MELLTGNWEYVLLALYVLEKGIKLSPSKKDDILLLISHNFIFNFFYYYTS